MLVEDETEVLLYPPLRAAWAKRGTQSRVMLSGHNAKRVLFGALDVAHGQRLLLSRRRQRAEDFCAFLRALRKKFPQKALHLILDSAPSHTAAASQRQARHLGVELLFLPVRSPELNPMDSLWRHAKQTLCANHQYPDLIDEVQALLQYFDRLADPEVLRKAGVLSKRFWLKHVRSKLICGPT